MPTTNAVSQRRWYSGMLVIASFCTLLIIACAALSIALFAKSDALDASRAALAASNSDLKLAQCINTNLGVRDAPNRADRAATQKWLTQLDTSLKAAFTGQPGALTEIQQAVLGYEQALAADDATRAKSPIGQC